MYEWEHPLVVILWPSSKGLLSLKWSQELSWLEFSTQPVKSRGMARVSGTELAILFMELRKAQYTKGLESNTQNSTLYSKSYTRIYLRMIT